METWHQRFFLSLLILFFVPVSLASTNDEAPQIYQPDEERIFLHEANINARDFELGIYTGLITVQDFGSDNVVGLKLNYHVSEYFFAQVNAGQSSIKETSFEKLTNIRLGDNDKRDYNYYNIGLGYNLFQGESFFGDDTAFNSSFSLTAALGSSKFLGDSYHTVTLGFAYKVIFLDWLSVDLGVNDHLFRSDIFTDSDALFHNVEIYTGINYIF